MAGGGLSWRGTLALSPDPSPKSSKSPPRHLAVGTLLALGMVGAPSSRPRRESGEKLARKVLGSGVVALPVAPGGKEPGTQRRQGASWSPSDVPTPLPCVVLVGSRLPINLGSRDLNSLWPSPVTGSKTNSSSCKLSITGKVDRGWPGAGEEGGRARSCYPPRGQRGRRPRAAGWLGLRLLFSLSVRAALTLCVLRSPSSRNPARWGVRVLIRRQGPPPRGRDESPRRSREVWSWYSQAPGGRRPPLLPRGCSIMGVLRVLGKWGEVTLRGPGVRVSEEAM